MSSGIEDIYRNRNSIFSIVIISVLVAFVIFIVIYFILTQRISVNIDFPYLLSLVVSMFALGLSIVFYFKASETSNKFYDNTYKYTHDISEKIGRMDERFGERLTLLDKNINKYLDLDIKNVHKIKNEIKKEEEEVTRISGSREEMINVLVEQSNIPKEEKKNYIDKINELFDKESDKKQKINKLEMTITSKFYDAESVISQLEKIGEITPKDWKNLCSDVKLLTADLGIRVRFLYRNRNNRLSMCIFNIRAYQDRYLIHKNDSALNRLIQLGYIQQEKLSMVEW
jgi:ABC-type multidrug transport system fused ATPase/permease subunit